MASEHPVPANTQGRYNEAEAQVVTTPLAHGNALIVNGKLETLTNENTKSVYFRIKAGTMEFTAQVADPVKLEQIGLSILAIARLQRQ